MTRGKSFYGPFGGLFGDLAGDVGDSEPEDVS
jgi:hypothetical protein